MNQKKQRILFVTSGLGIGGAEKMLLRLLGEISKEFDVMVIAMKASSQLGSGDIIEKQIKALGVEVHDGVGLNNIASVMWSVMRFNPQIIQGWMYNGNIAATILSFLCRARLVFGIRHSMECTHLYSWLTRLAIKICGLFSGLADVVVYNSSSGLIGHIESGYSKTNAKMIPNGLDFNRYAPNEECGLLLREALNLDEDVCIVGMFARFHPMKRHEFFLRAAAKVIAQNPKIAFVMAGFMITNENHELYGAALRLGIKDRIFLLGPRTDMPELTAGCDIIINCSSSEGFANNLLEGVACGAIAIATDSGDARILLGDEWVVDVNDIESLTAKILYAASLSRESRHQLASAGRASAMAQYSLEMIASQYAALYKSLIAQ